LHSPSWFKFLHSKWRKLLLEMHKNVMNTKLLFFCHIQMKVTATSLTSVVRSSSASHAITWEGNCELNKKLGEELIAHFRFATNWTFDKTRTPWKASQPAVFVILRVAFFDPGTCLPSRFVTALRWAYGHKENKPLFIFFKMKTQLKTKICLGLSPRMPFETCCHLICIKQLRKIAKNQISDVLNPSVKLHTAATRMLMNADIRLNVDRVMNFRI
jgi:hypothetical protein